MEDNQKWRLGFISLAFLFITSSSTEFLIEQVTQGRGTESDSSFSLEANLGGTRDEPPSSKILTITSFSVIKERGEPYESSVFEAAGYKWRLVLYVNGNKKDGGKDHISLYVRIEETESLPKDWEVNVDLKLFVYNGNQSEYLTVTDGLVKRYSDEKKELGYAQLIPQSMFYKTEGYIEHDIGSFGAEIFIVKPTQKQEKVTFLSPPPNNVFTWKMHNFSTLEVDRAYYSDEFLVGDRYWRLRSRPKISDGEGRVSLYLSALGHMADAVKTNTWGAFNLRVKDQLTSNDEKTYAEAWYPSWSGYGWGTGDVIYDSELKDPSKGYLVDDTIIFEAEMVEVSVTNIVPA